jgi:hypothetical protein
MASRVDGNTCDGNAGAGVHATGRENRNETIGCSMPSAAITEGECWDSLALGRVTT